MSNFGWSPGRIRNLTFQRVSILNYEPFVCLVNAQSDFTPTFEFHYGNAMRSTSVTLATRARLASINDGCAVENTRHRIPDKGIPERVLMSTLVHRTRHFLEVSAMLSEIFQIVYR